MKTLGLLGGMSWESTLHYYRLINQHTRHLKGGHHSAPLLLHSFDFAYIEALQRSNDWPTAAALLSTAATSLAASGADAIVLCTNTMHHVADDISAAAGVPLLHIADFTGRAVKAAGVGCVGLLGTRFTMEMAFYVRRLEERFGVAVVVPEVGDREVVHRVIYEELCQGVVREESREVYRGVVERLKERGAEGVVLGCTEIGMLVGEEVGEFAGLKVFDTTGLHAEGVVEWAVKNDEGGEGEVDA